MRLPVRNGKVFGIGLSGTGSHSLIAALHVLGYRAKHHPKRLDQFDEYEALADIPVGARYRFLDVAYPGSKFILTVRDLEGWLDSRSRKQPDTKPRELWVLENRFALYGRIDTQFERQRLTDAYERHCEGVAEYFRDRPGDLLTMNIIAGDGWEPLCRFLGKPMPGVAFPWVRSEKAQTRKGFWARKLFT